jgi:hypothetical protein
MMPGIMMSHLQCKINVFCKIIISERTCSAFRSIKQDFASIDVILMCASLRSALAPFGVRAPQLASRLRFA